MVESALAGLSPQQRRHLRELGLEPLRLRAATTVPTKDRVAGAPRACLYLSLSEGGAVPGDDPRIRAILRALGVTADEVTETATPGVPGLSLPAPEKLRRGAVKRALWPTLRGLRRTLSESGYDR